jgi:predicted nucleic acid-binding protein
VILVDSSVWVDFFRGKPSVQTDLLDSLLDSHELGIGDLVFTEVLQGCKLDKEFNEVRRLLGRLELITLGGEDIVVEAANNYRKLRRLGLTVRGTIDVVLATRCIVSGHQLLHSDRDFDAFERHLGLRCVRSGSGA